MTRGPNTVPCLNRTPDGPVEEGRTVHAWHSTGLDVVAGVLCSTRRCVWCSRAEHTTYGARRASWKETT